MTDAPFATFRPCMALVAAAALAGCASNPASAPMASTSTPAPMTDTTSPVVLIDALNGVFGKHAARA